MKAFIMLAIFSFSASSFAMSTERLIRLCQPAGIEKLKFQAERLGSSLDRKSVRECGVDNRMFNPSKYVWFCGKTVSGKKLESELTQKSVGMDCY